MAERFAEIAHGERFEPTALYLLAADDARHASPRARGGAQPPPLGPGLFGRPRVLGGAQALGGGRLQETHRPPPAVAQPGVFGTAAVPAVTPLGTAGGGRLTPGAGLLDSAHLGHVDARRTRRTPEDDRRFDQIAKALTAMPSRRAGGGARRRPRRLRRPV